MTTDAGRMNDVVRRWLLPVMIGVLAGVLTVDMMERRIQTAAIDPEPVVREHVIPQTPLMLGGATGTLHATGGYQRFKEVECRWCTHVAGLEVHHIVPQHTILQQYAAKLITLERAKDLLDKDPLNFITFCDRCHLVVGHQCRWANDVTNLTEILRAAGKERGKYGDKH